jgi:hypothetical protein
VDAQGYGRTRRDRKLSKILFVMSKDRRRILIKSELSVLQGERMRNIWILVCFLTLTFIGLGHSVGGVKNLEKRMNNPFTRWVNLPINSSQFDISEKMQKEFQSKSLRDSFLLDTLSGYKRDFIRVVEHSGEKSYSMLTRTIQSQEPLFKEILKPSNLHAMNTEESLHWEEEPCWVIVKREVLELLHPSLAVEDIEWLEVRNSYSSDRYFTHYFPILAVVEDLPDLVDMVMPVHLVELLTQVRDEESQFVNVSSTNKLEFMHKEPLEEAQLEETWALQDSVWVEALGHRAFDLNGETYYVHEVYLSQSYEIGEKLELLEPLLKIPGARGYTSYQCYSGQLYEMDKAYYLAFDFRALSHVRKLRDWVKMNYGFEISLNQVEDKENFAMMARLTLLLSLLLFLLSLAGILVFIVNLLVHHFEKIQKNLGTFKAFGLSNEQLMRDYTLILMLFFGKSLGFSLLLSGLYQGLSWALGWHYTLLHWSIPLAIVIMLVAIRGFVVHSIGIRLRKTPGDLIYQR